MVFECLDCQLLSSFDPVFAMTDLIITSLPVTQPPAFEVLMAARGFVKIVEYHLLQYRKNHSNKVLRNDCRKVSNFLFLF